jgi:hypothetical protein
MAIDCWLVTVDGERVESVLDVAHGAKDLLRVSSDTIFLRFIDPYGYTMFNRLQCLELHDEWTAAAAQLTTDEVRHWAVEVARLIRRCADEYGFFVRFVGE